jgi:hypothetical protein
VFLILGLGTAVVNWPARGFFKQSALKNRASARKLVVLSGREEMLTSF